MLERGIRAVPLTVKRRHLWQDRRPIGGPHGPLPRLLVSPSALGPVHHVPPGAHVVGAAVLVLEVIRVLPDVAAEHGRLAGHEWAVLVGRAFDGERAAAVERQPAPSAAEPARARLGELLLELREPA